MKFISLFVVLSLFQMSCSSMGTSPSEEKIKGFLKSRQYNQETEKFENRRPGLIDKDRDEAMTFSFFIDYFRGVEDSEPNEKLPESKVDIEEFLKGNEKVKFIWLGHSSLLVNFEGKILLVDPVFSDSAAPVSFLSKRFQPPVIELQELPKIDLILISHDHYDHLDMETIEFFKGKSITFVTPLGVGSHLEGWGIDSEKIIEKDWMESYSFEGIEFTATPSQHFSGRGLSDVDKTLWASWVIKSRKHSIYFSGDSGFDTHFKDIGEKFGPFDIAFVENGQYHDTFKAGHLLPEEVAIAYKELNAKKVFPIHWGMFALNMHPWYEPPVRLLNAVKSKEDVVTPKIGFLYSLDALPTLERWWEKMK